MLERWTRTVLRFRLAFLVLWLAVLGPGIWSATRLSPLLSNSFAVPGTDSERAREIIAHDFGEHTDGTFTVVFRVPHASDRAQQRLTARRLAAAARLVPTGHPDTVRTGAGVLWADLATNLDLRHAKRYTQTIRDALRAQRGPPALVTGQPGLSTARSRSVPVVRTGLRRARARVSAAGVQAGDQGRLLIGATEGNGYGPSPRDLARKAPRLASASAPRSA